MVSTATQTDTIADALTEAQAEDEAPHFLLLLLLLLLLLGSASCMLQLIATQKFVAAWGLALPIALPSQLSLTLAKPVSLWNI